MAYRTPLEDCTKTRLEWHELLLMQPRAPVSISSVPNRPPSLGPQSVLVAKNTCGINRPKLLDSHHADFSNRCPRGQPSSLTIQLVATGPIANTVAGVCEAVRRSPPGALADVHQFNETLAIVRALPFASFGKTSVAQPPLGAKSDSFAPVLWT